MEFIARTYGTTCSYQTLMVENKWTGKSYQVILQPSLKLEEPLKKLEVTTELTKYCRYHVKMEAINNRKVVPTMHMAYCYPGKRTVTQSISLIKETLSFSRIDTSSIISSGDIQETG